MSFREAVRSGFDHYARFDGRASRPAFWWWFLFAIVVAIAFASMDGTVFEESLPLTLLAWAGLFLPSLSVAIRRLHDTDRSGWWILISLIPVIGSIVLLVFYLQGSDPGDNSYGPPMAGRVA